MVVGLTHPMTRGTLNNPAPGRRIGRIRQRGLRAERWPDLVRAIGGIPREHAGGWRNAARVHLLHFVGVREDIAELAREQLNLVRVQFEVGEGWQRPPHPLV